MIEARLTARALFPSDEVRRDAKRTRQYVVRSVNTRSRGSGARVHTVPTDDLGWYGCGGNGSRFSAVASRGYPRFSVETDWNGSSLFGFKSSPVTFNEDGGADAYTVADGDTGYSIGERFCVNYISVYKASGEGDGTLQPGQVLNIDPLRR